MKCMIDGCDREAHYKDAQLCQKHYFRRRRNGHFDIIKVRKPFIQNDAGYRSIWEPTHPLAGKTGYVFEHRKIIFDKHGLTLPDCEICGKPTSWETCHIDHKDENPSNNAPDNLRPLCPGCNTWRSMPPMHTFNRCSALTFDGITQTAHEWARDSRVKVSSRQILARKRKGATDYDALFSEKITHNGKPKTDNRPRKTQFKHQRKNAVRVEIDGEIKTAAEWAAQPDCKVSRAGIVWRLRQGWSHKEAVYGRDRAQ